MTVTKTLTPAPRPRRRGRQHHLWCLCRPVWRALHRGRPRLFGRPPFRPLLLRHLSHRPPRARALRSAVCSRSSPSGARTQSRMRARATVGRPLAAAVPRGDATALSLPSPARPWLAASALQKSTTASSRSPLGRLTRHLPWECNCSATTSLGRQQRPPLPDQQPPAAAAVAAAQCLLPGIPLSPTLPAGAASAAAAPGAAFLA